MRKHQNMRHKRIRVKGGNIIDTIVKHSKDGITYFTTASVNGIKSLVPILQRVGGNTVMPVVNGMLDRYKGQAGMLANHYADMGQNIGNNLLSRGASSVNNAVDSAVNYIRGRVDPVLKSYGGGANNRPARVDKYDVYKSIDSAFNPSAKSQRGGSAYIRRIR